MRVNPVGATLCGENLQAIRGLRARRALLIGAGRAAVYEWRDNVAIRQAVFATGEEGRQGFREYLGDTPGIPFYLLVDLVDEEYRHDTVPHVARRDRQALLRRKAARLFKDTGYWFCRVTGRETTGRREDRVLLGALVNPGVVRQWVVLLDEARAPLVGICSLPLFSGQLLQSIAGRDDGCRVLVSMQSVSGLRQTCFDHGEFRFSRLVPASRAEPEGVLPLIRDEVAKVLRYLDSRRPGASGAPVHVHLLFDGDVLRELKSVLEQQDSVRYHFCDRRALTAAECSRAPGSNPYSDVYFMQQLFRRRPDNHYAGSAEKRWLLLQRLRAGIAVAALVLLCGGTGWCALNVYGGMVFYFAGNAAEAQARRYAAQYELAGQHLPETPVDPPGLKAVVMVADRLARYKTSPATLAATLGQALRGFPSVHLGRLAWTATWDPGVVFAGTTGPTAVPGAMDVAGARTLYQAALVNGRIEPFNGNFREAMETVNRFAEDLRGRESVYDVEIVALPLDTSSGAALQGNIQSLQRQADFTLKLVLESSHET